MKVLFLSLFVFFQASASELSTFDILPGKLHKGGVLTASGFPDANGVNMNVSVVYEIRKRDLVPVPSQYLKGTYDQKLPAQFLTEQGYLDLEKSKSIHLEDASVEHLGRVAIGSLSDAHLIHIIPDNHRSEMFLVYHPSIAGLGWDQLKLVLHTEIPLLRDYVIEGKLHTP
jgi:hypothetical protein